MKKLYAIALCLFIGIMASSAQTTSVNGTVIDDSGSPIVGASVIIKGTTTGVTSGLDGSFRLTAPNKKSILVVSYIGYESQEVPVGQNIRVVLRAETLTMEQIVVTGITATDKRMFTGAADKLVAENMKLDGIADISRSLEGRSAGVSVQNVSGTFGTAPKIRVRGATSIYGNSKPLWVVDGVIMEDITEVTADELSSGDAVTMISSAIAGLNTDDIESFQILKDGSATSIYGARAMAGVIVVTTKKGRPGTTKLTYTGEFTTRLKPSYRNFNLMNSQDQMGIYQELKAKGWLNYGDVYRAQESGVYGKMYDLINTYDPSTGQFALENTPEARNAYLRDAEMRNTDWFNKLFNNNIMMNHMVSMSTGTEKSTTYVSISAMNDPGWYKKSNIERYTFNANTSFNITKKLTFNMLGNASYRKQHAPGTLSQQVDAVNGTVSRDFDINPYSYALNTSRTMDPYTDYIRNYTEFNIIDELKHNHISLNVVDLKFQSELKWKAAKGLELSAMGAVKYASTSQQHIITESSNQARAYREMRDATIRDKNPYLYKDPDITNSIPVTILDHGGFYEKREYSMRSYDFRASASYNNLFNKVHQVNLLGGMEVNSVDRMNDWSRGWGMQYEKGEKPFFNYLAFKKQREGNQEYYTLKNTKKRLAAFFFNGVYSYDMRYVFNGTVRYEGSNRLGKSRSARWLPTWNVSGAWNVHEEKFFDALRPTLSHLTLKGSYSLTADAGPEWVTNSRAVIDSYIPWRPSATLGEPGLMITSLENSELTYEKKHEFNIGLDLGFLDNRINVEAAWYRRNNYDLIGRVATQGVGGEILKWANSADMKSYGLEFTLSTRNIVTKDFRWNTDLTFAYNKNKITKLKSAARIMDLILGQGGPVKGYSHRGLFSIPFIGLDNEGMPMFQMGEKIFDKNNYDEIDLQSRELSDFQNLKYEGQIDPKVTGGFGNIFTYKNLRLNIFITYSFGNKIRLDPVFDSEYNDHMAMPKEFKNRWMIPGEENITNIPVIVDKHQSYKYGKEDLRRGYNAYNYSSARVADGSFIRMKEVSLSYDLPKSITKNWAVSDISFKLQATNLFLIYADSKLNGQDPEFFRSGGVSAPMPQQFTLTIKLGF